MIKHKVSLTLLFIILAILIIVAGSEIVSANVSEIKIINKKFLNETLLKADSGKAIYTNKCMSCHQVDGSGVPGTYPPLQKSAWVSGDKIRLINVVLNGLEGEIIVNDETYINSMPKLDYLTDNQIAQVLTFVRQNFNNSAGEVISEEVAKLRKK